MTYIFFSQSPMWATLLLFILFLLAWLLHTERTAIHRAGQRLPQLPGTLPLAGYGIWFLRPRYILLQWFAQIQPKMGFDTFEVRVPSLPPAVLVNSPVCLEQILKDTSTFVKGNFFRSRSWDLFGRCKIDLFVLICTDQGRGWNTQH